MFRIIPTVSAAVAALAIAACVAGQTATFDSFPEGLIGRSFTDAGITFQNYNNRLDPPPSNFVAERADGTLTGLPGFTSPNALGFGGYSPGPAAAFTRMGSFEFHQNSIANFASVELYGFGSSNAGRTVTLEGWLGSTLVTTDTVTMAGGFTVEHQLLMVEGPDCDLFRVIVGPADTDVVFVVVDTITVNDDGSLELLNPTPGLAGQNNTLTAINAQAGARVFFGYGVRAGATPVPGCSGLFVDIDNARVGASATADANGTATVTSFVPSSAAGRPLLLQAVDTGWCTTSNLVNFTFQ
ncbi:MAG: hypothetical protein ACF8PN_04140 [Phycisphaerales bacterium]